MRPFHNYIIYRVHLKSYRLMRKAFLLYDNGVKEIKHENEEINSTFFFSFFFFNIPGK